MTERRTQGAWHRLVQTTPWGTAVNCEPAVSLPVVHASASLRAHRRDLPSPILCRLGPFCHAPCPRRPRRTRGSATGRRPGRRQTPQCCAAVPPLGVPRLAISAVDVSSYCTDALLPRTPVASAPGPFCPSVLCPLNPALWGSPPAPGRHSFVPTCPLPLIECLRLHALHLGYGGVGAG